MLTFTPSCLRIAASVVLLHLAALSPAPALAQPREAAGPAPDFVVYQLKRGENLYTIAERYLDRIESYRTVQRLNRIADPRAVPVGTRLRIPTSILRAEPLTARIAAIRGTVRLQRMGQAFDAKVGIDLPQGTVIETGQDGFISLAMPNGSRTSLPTLSTLTIVHLRRFVLTQSIDYDFTVTAGKVETKAAPLGSGNGLFRIRTPRAVAAVRGTQFRVGVQGVNSLAEVLEGTVAAGASERASQPVERGFGAVIADGRLSREALLAPPTLLTPGKMQVDPLVNLAFEPVAGASGYHLQIATDASFADVIAEARAAAPAFAVAGIPNGGLFVRASAISGSGLEGMAQTYAMRRVLTGLGASAAADADRLTFKWSGTGDGRRIYRFQLARDETGAGLIVDEPGLVADGISLRALAPGTYYWRVAVRQFAGDQESENWLPFEKIIIATPEN